MRRLQALGVQVYVLNRAKIEREVDRLAEPVQPVHLMPVGGVGGNSLVALCVSFIPVLLWSGARTADPGGGHLR